MSKEYSRQFYDKIEKAVELKLIDAVASEAVLAIFERLGYEFTNEVAAQLADRIASRFDTDAVDINKPSKTPGAYGFSL